MSATVWKHLQTKIRTVTKGNVYAISRPAQAKPPYVVFNFVRGEPVAIKVTPTQDIVLVEVKYFDIGLDDAITNAEAIRTALEFYAGTSEGTTLKPCRCVEWQYPEVVEDEKIKVVYEAIYTYEIRLKL